MIKNRNINIDLIKCIAVFSVISVHFFPNCNWLYQPIDSWYQYLMVAVHAFFLICVPLFLITTGFLMKDKKLDKYYYTGILRVVIIYILDAILYLLYDSFYLNNYITIKQAIVRIFSFDIGYAWYVEMYIGLFLLIPFLNTIYNNLNIKKDKIILLITMLLITSLPGIFNIKYQILPEWWLSIYPITYYFIGCYIREYGLNISKVKSLLSILLIIIISTIISIYKTNDNIFTYGTYNDWGSIFNIILSVLVFNIVLNINLNKVNIKIKKLIVIISQLSFAMYLTSAVIDSWLYNNYFYQISFASFGGYCKIVPLVLILSIAMAMILNFIYDIINKMLKKIYGLVNYLKL